MNGFLDLLKWRQSIVFQLKNNILDSFADTYAGASARRSRWLENGARGRTVVQGVLHGRFGQPVLRVGSMAARAATLWVLEPVPVRGRAEAQPDDRNSAYRTLSILLSEFLSMRLSGLFCNPAEVITLKPVLALAAARV